MSRLAGRSSPYNVAAATVSFGVLTEQTFDETTVVIGGVAGFTTVALGEFVVISPGGQRVSDSAVGFPSIKASADGETWSHKATLVQNSQIRGITDDGTTAIISSIDGDGGAGSTVYQILKSTDLVTWSGGHDIDTDYNINSLAYGESKFVLLGYDFGVGAKIWTSPNGSAPWTERTVPAGFGVNTITYKLVYEPTQKFIGVMKEGSSSYCVRSADGVTWDRVAFNSQYITYLAVSPTLIVAIGANGTDFYCEWSDDGGDTWNVDSYFEDLHTIDSKSLETYAGSPIEFADPFFTVLAREGAGTSGDPYRQTIHASEDGDNWTEHDTIPEVFASTANERSMGIAHKDGKVIFTISDGVSAASGGEVTVVKTD